MAETACPDRERLRQLLESRLSDAEQLDLEGHLSSCGVCQAALERLAGGTGILPALNSSSFPAQAPSEPVLQQLISNFKQPILGADASPTAILRRALREDADAFSGESPDLGRLGPYEILGVICRGSNKIILKAFDREQRRLLAAKVSRFPAVGGDKLRRNFLRQARAGALVQHENLVAVRAVEATRDFAYCMLDYVPGPSVQDRLEREGAFPLPEILQIGRQTALALAAAHAQGLSHRGLTPSKILLLNGLEQVRVAGLGQTTSGFERPRMLDSSAPVKMHYLSPEQARGESPEPPADLFSLGSVLYAMCTGRPPFYRGSIAAVVQQIRSGPPHPISELNSEIPAWLVQLIGQLHAPLPAERIVSAAEVAERLRIGLVEYAAWERETSDSGAYLVQRPRPAKAAPPPAGDFWRRVLGWISVLQGRSQRPPQ